MIFLDPQQDFNTNARSPTPDDIHKFVQATMRDDVTTVCDYIERFGKNIVNASCRQKFPLLLWVATMETPDAIPLFIQHGADLEAKNPFGFTALIYAAYNGKTRCMEALLDNGADINARNEDERTGLMFAAAEGFKDTVISLITRGAKLDLTDREQETAAQLAAWEEHFDIVDILHGAEASKMTTGIETAVKTGGQLKLKKPNQKVNS